MKSDLIYEEKLLKTVKNDKNAFSEVYQYFLEDVYRFSYTLVKNRHDAEDITSRVFEAFFRKIDQFEWKGISMKFWLFKTARIYSYELFKEPNTTEYDDYKIENEYEITFVDKIMNKNLVNQVKNLLLEFNSVDRTIVELRIWEESPFKEIAEILELSESACKKRFYRAIEKIKQKVDEKVKAKVVLPFIFTSVKASFNSDEFKLDKNLQFNKIKNKDMNNILQKINKFWTTTLGKVVVLGIAGLAVISGITAYVVTSNDSNNTAKNKIASNIKPTSTEARMTNTPNPTISVTNNISPTGVQPSNIISPTSTVSPTQITIIEPTEEPVIIPTEIIIPTATPEPLPANPTYTSPNFGVSFEYPVGATVSETAGYCRNKIDINYETNRFLYISFNDPYKCAASGSSYEIITTFSSPVLLTSGQSIFRVQYYLNNTSIPHEYLNYYDIDTMTFGEDAWTKNNIIKSVNPNIYSIAGHTTVSNDTIFDIVVSTLR